MAVAHKVYYALCLITRDPVVQVLLIMRDILAFFMRENKFCDQKCHWFKSTDCLERSVLDKLKRHAFSFATITAMLVVEP